MGTQKNETITFRTLSFSQTSLLGRNTVNTKKTGTTVLSEVVNSKSTHSVHLLLLIELLLGHGEVIVLHPLLREELGHVVTNGVRKDDDNTLTLGDIKLLNSADSSRHGGARRTTAQETLRADKATSHDEGLLILSLDPLIDERTVKNIRDEIITNTLNLVRAALSVKRLGLSKDGTVRINTNDLDGGDLLLELLGKTRDGTTSTSSRNKVINLTIALVNELLSSAVIVSKRVRRVDVLIENVGVGELRVELLGDTNVRLGGIPGSLGGGADNLSTKSLQDINLLLGHLLREGDDHLVTLKSSSEGHTDTSVTRGGLNEDVSGLNAARGLGIANHSLANTVLDGTTSVEELALGKNLALNTFFFSNLVDANKGGTTNVLKDRVINFGLLETTT